MNSEMLSILVALVVTVSSHGSPSKPTLSWSSLGLKTNCPETKWTSQLSTVRTGLTSCLGLSNIRLPDKFSVEDSDEDTEEAICALADKWPSCWHYLDGLSCIEAPVTRGTGLDDYDIFGLDFGATNAQEDDSTRGLAAMTATYRQKCTSAKVVSTPEPGDDQFFDPLLGEDGEWPEGRLHYLP